MRIKERANELQKMSVEYYLDVLWLPCDDYAFETGQLLFGQWSWYYPIPRPRLGPAEFPWTPPLGMSIENVDELLQEFKLLFPTNLPYPRMELEMTHKRSE